MYQLSEQTKKNKLERKMRFLPFFPYGFCSPLATALDGMNNQYATQILLHDPSNPGQDIRTLCAQHRENTVSKAKYLCKQRYARDTRRVCGTPPKTRSFRFVTVAGLTALTDAPVLPDDPEESTKPNDRKIKENDSCTTSPASAAFREMLYDYATSPAEGDGEVFADLLLESVMDGYDTPLSYAIAIAPEVKTAPNKYSQNQLYAIWKLSHINTMFRLNGHLTCLDRRPYSPSFSIDGIDSEESYKVYLEKFGHTPASMTYYALSNWYQKNPGYYRFTQQYPDDSPEAKAEWLNTPAFYSIRELPNFNDRNSLADNENGRGSQKKMNTVFVGLAMGRRANYVCYHAKTGPVKWLRKRESETKEEIARSIRHMKTQCPEMPGRDTADFGLYFCTDYFQFLALFDRTIERHKKGLRGNFQTDAPFVSLHTVPVNDSGTFLLWCLMEYSPIETETRICRSLVAQQIGFEYQTNRYFPLTYQGKWVFVGYTMDVSKINHALEMYLDGMSFYLCCFPEQAMWYEKLFPGITIL